MTVRHQGYFHSGTRLEQYGVIICEQRKVRSTEYVSYRQHVYACQSVTESCRYQVSGAVFKPYRHRVNGALPSYTYKNHEQSVWSFEFLSPKLVSHRCSDILTFVASPFEIINIVTDTNYNTSAIRKVMLNMPTPGSLQNIGLFNLSPIDLRAF